jgi:hypothetical protein
MSGLLAGFEGVESTFLEMSQYVWISRSKHTLSQNVPLDRWKKGPCISASLVPAVTLLIALVAVIHRAQQVWYSDVPCFKFPNKVISGLPSVLVVDLD